VVEENGGGEGVRSRHVIKPTGLFLGRV